MWRRSLRPVSEFSEVWENTPPLEIKKRIYGGKKNVTGSPASSKWVYRCQKNTLRQEIRKRGFTDVLNNMTQAPAPNKWVTDLCKNVMGPMRQANNIIDVKKITLCPGIENK